MTCAVCNNGLTKDNASAMATHDNREYFFCSEACEQKYQARLAYYDKTVRRTKAQDEFRTQRLALPSTTSTAPAPLLALDVTR